LKSSPGFYLVLWLGLGCPALKEPRMGRLHSKRSGLTMMALARSRKDSGMPEISWQICYRLEKQYSFESYVTKLSAAFKILKDNTVEKAERKKVDCLLDGIQSDNQIVDCCHCKNECSHEPGNAD
jgi:hypothetical protein